MTPEEWLANFESKIAEVQQKAAEFKQNLEASGATETSEDGALRVSVAPNGALTDLSIDDAALRGSGAELAAKIMKLARKAQRSAAVHVADAFAPLAGADSESLRMVTGYLPPEEDEEPEQGDDRNGQSYAFTNDQAEAEPATRSGEPPRRPARPRSSPDDDDDFGNDQIFGRREDW